MRALNATWATCTARAGPGGLPKRERLEHGGGHRDDGTACNAKGKQRVPTGRRLVLELPGGGGFGDPAERDPADAERDHDQGYLE